MKRKIVLAYLLMGMFLLLSTGFAQLSGQEPGPLHDEKDWVKIVDPSASVAALLNGEIDVTGVPTWADLDNIVDAGFKVVEAPTMALKQFWLCVDRAPTSDVKLRHAIAHLIPKEAIIEELWGPMAKYEYNLLPATMWWYNTNIPDVTTFEPDLAAHMLDDAGYTMGTDGWRIDPETGTKMRELQIVSLVENTPADNAFAERWVDELHKVGVPARVEFTAVAGGAWYTKTVVNRDFDAFLWYWSWGKPDPVVIDWLYRTKGVLPISGMKNATFDEQMTIAETTLNETEAKEATWKAQEILTEELPAIPLFNPVGYTAVNPDLLGIVGAPYLSTNALLRWRWKTGPTGTIKVRTDSEPASLILATDMTVITSGYVWAACDLLVDAQPFTGEWRPNIATSWKTESWSDLGLGVAKGTKITLWVGDNLYWHDGIKFTAYDLEFAAKYGTDFKIARLSDALNALVDVKAVNDTQVEFYYNRTSLLIFSSLTWGFGGYYMTAFPKHLYNPNASRYGAPEGPIGLQEADKAGVPDPAKFAAAFVAHPNPPADKPWLTCFIGVGAWILKKYEWGVGATFVANRDYHMTVLVTDTNFDRKTDILDIAVGAKAFGTHLGDPRWVLMCDINGDDNINIIDLASIAKDFGKEY